MWLDTFKTLITQGYTKVWLTTRLDKLYSLYPEQFTVGEYQEILDLINAMA